MIAVRRVIGLLFAAFASGCLFPSYTADGQQGDGSASTTGAAGSSAGGSTAAACPSPCPDAPNAKGVCVSGACKLACDPGFADCNGTTDDGCELPVSSDLANCGGCGSVCAPAHATPVCNGGTCGIAMCEPLFGDCDNSPSNGCERDLTAKLDCGACNSKCIGNRTCVMGVCQ